MAGFFPFSNVENKRSVVQKYRDWTIIVVPSFNTIQASEVRFQSRGDRLTIGCL